jgi:A/G-specific adenine glycosylase
VTFAERVLQHYRRHRRDLPWRRTRDPYAIWVSEIMLQQTRVATVVDYWERWMKRFPTVRALAEAPLDDVLALWSGLGYYRRARMLHLAAREVVARFGGSLPEDPELLGALPGLGPYTAGAVASIAFDKPFAVVDGNVERILARVHAIARPGKLELWALARSLVPARDAGDYNQGLMDIGATICSPVAPRCLVCPLADICRARETGRQAELPEKKAKRPTPAVAVDAALVTKAGRWLLCRRLPEGLFGGLWELPDTAALAGVTVEKTVLAEHTHQLTHRTMRYRVRAGRGTPRPLPPYDRARWISPEAISELGVSSATLALVTKLCDIQHPWPTPNAPRSSSSKGSRRSSKASPTSATTPPTTPTSPRPPTAPRARSRR